MTWRCAKWGDMVHLNVDNILLSLHKQFNPLDDCFTTGDDIRYSVTTIVPTKSVNHFQKVDRVKDHHATTYLCHTVRVV